MENTWRVFTPADAYAPRPPVVYVVDGLFPLPSLSIVYGAPSSLKSFLLADMSVCVVTGQKWLDSHFHTGRDTLRSPVMWIDLDNGPRRMHERFAALGRAYGMKEDDPLFYYVMPSPWPDLSRRSDVESMALRALSHSAKVIIIDNLGVAIGGADENSAEMAGVMANVRWLCESTGAAVIIIHHQRKASGIKSRLGESLRGHSSIEASLDLALLVERADGRNEVIIKATKSRDVLVKPFSASFVYEHEEGSQELAVARFYGNPVIDSSSSAAIEQVILEVLRDGPMNQSQLQQAVKEYLPNVGVRRISAVAKRMIDNGSIHSSNGPRNSLLLFA